MFKRFLVFLGILRREDVNGPEQEAEVDRLRRQVQQLQADIDGYREEYARQNERIKLLTENLTERKAKFEQKEEPEQCIAVDVNTLSDAALTTAIEVLQQEVVLLKASLNEADIQNQALAGSIGILEKQLADIKAITNAEKLHETTEPYIQKVEHFIHTRLFLFLDQLEFYKKRKERFSILEESLQAWKNLKRKPWMHGKTVIAFMGKFSSGKSSIINSLLGEDLLAVGTTETTAISAYISSGNRFKAQFTDIGENIRPVDHHTFKGFSKDSFEDFGLRSWIRHFAAEVENPLLEKCSILDTPGFDSNDPEDSCRAIEAAKESDYIFWIYDVNDGVPKADSLNFIKKYLQEKKLYIIISKVDSKPGSSVDESKRNTIKTLEKEGIRFEECLPFSRKREELKQGLASTMKRIINNEKKGFMEEMADCLEEAKASINDTLTIAKAQIAELEKKTGQLNAETTKIVSASATSNTLFVKKLNSMTSAINTQIKDRYVAYTITDYPGFLQTYNSMAGGYNEFNQDYQALVKRLDPVWESGTLSRQIELEKGQLKRLQRLQQDIFQLQNEFQQLTK